MAESISVRIDLKTFNKMARFCGKVGMKRKFFIDKAIEEHLKFVKLGKGDAE